MAHPRSLPAAGAALDRMLDALEHEESLVPEISSAIRTALPGYGEVPIEELAMRQLLPSAERGLARLGIDKPVAQHYLGIIDGRARTGRNGASWQIAAVQHFESEGANRQEALEQMVRAYARHMHSNQPVHEWPLP